MFGALLKKECAQTAKSMVYWLIVAVMAIFFFSQLGNLDITGEPKQGQKEYGYTYSTDENLIMEATLGILAQEYMRGSYTTYPIGFYKEVKLNKQEEKQIGQILAETTGLTDKKQIEKAVEANFAGNENVMTNARIQPVNDLNYQQFKSLMKKADDILGGGSNYSESFMKKNAYVPMTYEQAVKEFQNMIQYDHFTGGYARLFCDYMGIVVSFLPVFLAVTRGMRDRRSKMQELIAVRKVSAATVIVSRYLSMVIMIMLPLLLLSCFPLAECMQYASRANISYDILAFVKYSFGWLMPSVMTAVAVGTVLTELTDTALAILVAGIWWFVDTFRGMAGMQGGEYGWLLIPRHNTPGGYEVFREGFYQLVLNRVFYTVFALVLVAAAVGIYSLKRRGRLDIYGKISVHWKRKSKA